MPSIGRSGQRQSRRFTQLETAAVRMVMMLRAALGTKYSTARRVASVGTPTGASPLTVPAAVTSFVADMTYVTRLQLRLAYDMSVLYGIRIDPDDPEDMWKLIRVALTINGGEMTRSGASRVVPALVRPLVRKYFSGATRVAAQSLPVVWRHLLVRNVIKVGIPVVGVPLSTVLNRYTTLIAGRHAQDVFRNEARIVEMVERFCDGTGNPSLTMWVAWYAVLADGRTSDDEALLLRHLARVIKERHGFVDEELARVIDFDVLDLWERLDAEDGDLTDYVAMATRVAEVDGELTYSEAEAIEVLRQRCEADYEGNVDPGRR
jgi:uncharacterized protein (DUF697 family)